MPTRPRQSTCVAINLHGTCPAGGTTTTKKSRAHIPTAKSGQKVCPAVPVHDKLFPTPTILPQRKKLSSTAVFKGKDDDVQHQCHETSANPLTNASRQTDQQLPIGSRRGHHPPKAQGAGPLPSQGPLIPANASSNHARVAGSERLREGPEPHWHQQRCSNTSLTERRNVPRNASVRRTFDADPCPCERQGAW